MGDAGEDVRAAVVAAAGTARHVRSVPMVRFGHEDGTGRVLVVLRVGLPPALTLTDVVTAVAHVQLAVARALPRGAAVFVEPDVAHDEGTPTEAIVIRALE